jgi:hypothetical protein
VKPLLQLIISAFALQNAMAQTLTDVDFRLRVKRDPPVFHIGELIELELSYSTSHPHTYGITSTGDARSNCGMCEIFWVTPSKGVSDPSPDTRPLPMDFLSQYTELGEQPVKHRAILNEWLSFSQPGVYILHGGSRRITRLGVSIAPVDAKDPPAVLSSPIELTILDADATWIHDQLSEIRSILDSSPRRDEREAAERRLRYLGTRQAAEELARRFVQSEELEDIVCELDSGLRESPFPDAVIPILENALRDPLTPVRSRVVSMLASLRVTRQFGGRSRVPPNGDDYKERDAAYKRFQAEYEAILLGSLRQRSGPALATAVWTLWGQGAGQTNAGDGSQSAAATLLREELVAVAVDLPSNAQSRLLQWDWKLLPHEPLFPLIRQMALHDQNGSHREIALERWCELDSMECEPAVLAELARPGPLAPRLMTLLSAGERPAFDVVLRERLRSEQAQRNWYGVSTLIQRYASPSLAPDVRKALEGSNRPLICAFELQLIAYLLRVDQAEGWRLAKGTFDRRGSGDPCYRELLGTLDALAYIPQLGELAQTAFRNDKDPAVVGAAALVLSRHGPAEAETWLWDRLSSWSEKWHGQAETLLQRPGIKDPTGGEASLERTLAEALVHATAWEFSKSDYTRLSNLCVTDQCRSTVKNWADGFRW